MEYYKAVLHFHGYIDAARELLDTLRSRDISIVALTGSNRDLFMNLIESDEFNPHIKDLMDHRVAVLEYENKLFYLVRGTEYHSRDPEGNAVHLLSLGNNQELSFTRRENRQKPFCVLDIGKEIKDKNGIVVAAHPFARSFSGGPNSTDLATLLQASLLDTLEFNGQVPKILEKILRLNVRAKGFALENDFPIIATPDAHLLRNIDTAYFKVPKHLLDTSNGEAFIRTLLKTIRLSKIPSFSGQSGHLYEKLNCEGYISMADFCDWQRIKLSRKLQKRSWLLYQE